MFISDPIFKFHNLFYKQVTLLISYHSAQELARTLCRIEIRDRKDYCEFESILYENVYFLMKQERRVKTLSTYKDNVK